MSWFGRNDRRARPVAGKNLYEQDAKRQVRLVVGGMRDVSRFKKVIPGTIDRFLPALRERELPGEHVANPGADMVMHAKVSPWSERHLRGPHLELAVELVHVAEHGLFELDAGRQAPC